MANALISVANALISGVRARRWSGEQADEGAERLMQMPVEIHGEETDVRRAYELSRRYDEHPVYDFVYVALAERLGLPFVTADQRLARKVRGLGFVQLLGK